ncbi:MAG: hypothetical protein FJ290_02755 [Planctomycetes bacterium]|nr:hypothetical protein [Planctomycetota bacterium]
MPAPFIAKQAQLEAKIADWMEIAGRTLRVDSIASFSGHKVYALTLTDPAVPLERKRRCYFSQPHAHEPGTTAGMADAIEQLVTGKDLAGNATRLDIEKALAKAILTFNPIGNPQGREAAPVPCWDGSKYTNDQFWCWMRGEDPDNPGKMWKRLDLWDTRVERHPKRIGIVYEQIDEHRYVEPNRSHLSSFFKLFFKLDKEFRYERWLDLHQTEFEKSQFNCMVLLPIKGLAEGDILAEDAAWGQQVVDAWTRAGYRPQPKPVHLGYTGEQAEYFRKNWGELHKRMHCISTEVKNNAPDATPEFQMKAQAIAIEESIQRLV